MGDHLSAREPLGVKNTSVLVFGKPKVLYKQSADLCEVASALNFPDVALLTLNNTTDWTCQ